MAPSRRTVRWQCPSAKRALRSDLSGSAEGAVIARRPPGGGAFYFRLDIASVFESEQQGHNNAFLHGVRLPWSFGVSRARILALSLVAAITLTCGALAQGGGGGAGGGASGAGGAAGATGAGGTGGATGAGRAGGASGTPGTTGNSSGSNSGPSVQPPASTGQNAINSPGTGAGPGPNPGPLNK
jgi:hypothetical protein